MSGPAPIIGTTFIDRVNRREFSFQPKATTITLQRDVRSFTSPFDFELEFARGNTLILAGALWFSSAANSTADKTLRAAYVPWVRIESRQRNKR